MISYLMMNDYHYLLTFCSTYDSNVSQNLYIQSEMIVCFELMVSMRFFVVMIFSQLVELHQVTYDAQLVLFFVA